MVSPIAVIWSTRAMAACASRRYGLGAGVSAELCNVTVIDLMAIFARSDISG